MMLKKTILKYKTGQNLKKRILHANPSFSTSKKIAIIISDQFETESNIRNFLHELKVEGKSTNVLVFCQNPKNIQTPLPYYTINDISLTGEIQSKILRRFLREEYDFALCMDNSHHFMVDYVFSLLRTKCRVGFQHPTHNNLFELMVQSKNTKSAPSSEILRYLKMIQNV